MSFSLTIRVYAQDTDFGGVVHHTSYLRFMERARAEWAYRHGVALNQLATDGNYFVVRDAKVHYVRGATLGDEARRRYTVIIDDPERVGRLMREGLEEVRAFRRANGDAYYFNWRLKVDHEFQQPFVATHDAMRSLSINESLPIHELAANLRRAFSGIVSGNVREDTMTAIETKGPFEICAEGRYLSLLDGLLASFVSQGRMKLAREAYEPCYRVVD